MSTLITCLLDSLWILYGEVKCLSLLEVKWLTGTNFSISKLTDIILVLCFFNNYDKWINPNKSIYMHTLFLSGKWVWKHFTLYMYITNLQHFSCVQLWRHWAIIVLYLYKPSIFVKVVTLDKLSKSQSQLMP